MLGDPVRGRLREAKPAAKNKTKTVRLVEIPQRKAALASRRIWIAGGAAALVVVIAWLIFAPAPKEEASTPPPSGTTANGAATGESVNLPLPAAGGSQDTGRAQEGPLGFIKAVRLQPTQPTRMDTMKAEVTAAIDDPSRLTYTYVWKVNDQVIPGATGDFLKLSDFKKGDRIGVTVTPNDISIAGFAVASPEIAVHSIPPTLELEIKGPAGSTPDLQLVSVAPDSAQVTFSLENPLLPGMTIDKQSGKISWPRTQGLKGVFRFGAAVEDDNRTKVTKTFEITIK